MTLGRLSMILLGALALCTGCRHDAAFLVQGNAAQPIAGPTQFSAGIAAINSASPGATAANAIVVRPTPPPLLACESYDQCIPLPPIELTSATEPIEGPVNFNLADSPPPNSQEPYHYKHFWESTEDLWPEIKHDYKNYYSWDNFGMLAASFGVAAVFANTPIDRDLNAQYQKDVRSNITDHFARTCKLFGTGGYMFPAMVGGWVLGDTFADWPVTGFIGEWGERSLRAAAVGAPPMLFMQYLTGGSRPGEDDDGSGWRPFRRSNGVSGHAFVGGLVFIDAAKATDNGWLKAGFYACSFLPAWSRISDEAHYPSQAFLGWWMAYCAAAAVDETDRTASQWQVIPVPMDNGVGMGLSYQY